MGIAPGGLIKQCIIGDKHPSSAWDSERTVMFNVQILNSELFHAVTGKSPPKSPISAKTYAQHGLPFYKIYEEKSSIMGNFQNLKSITELDDIKDKSGTRNEEHEQHGETTSNNPIVLLNPEGFPMKFRHVSELERNLSRMKYANFE
jgi:hypothetical protein